MSTVLIPAAGLATVTVHWRETRDGDAEGLALYRRHYSCPPARQTHRGGGNLARFVGPGEKALLISTDGRAVFSWRRSQWRRDGQVGVECTIFRNEGAALSSTLIVEAESVAWRRWPAENRLFTYVNPRRVLSSNPGYCFQAAGWRRCGISKTRKLIAFEKLKEVAR